MSEVILNYSKILEVLFPQLKNEGNRDAARRGLADLGYTPDEYERCFIPAMSLRNDIDSGHVFLSVFKREQLNVLHEYTEAAEGKFRHLLQTIMENIENQTYDVPPKTDFSPKNDVAAIIEKIAAWRSDERLENRPTFDIRSTRATQPISDDIDG